MIHTDAHTSVEQLSETEFQARISTGVKNVFKHGAWQPLNQKIVPDGELFVTSSTEYDLIIDPNVVGYKVIIQGRESFCTLIEIDGKPFNANIDIEVIGNRVIWHDVVPDLDVMAYADIDRVIFFKVIKSELAPTKFKMELQGDTKWFKDEPQGRDSFYDDDNFTIADFKNTNEIRANIERGEDYLIHEFCGDVVKRNPKTRVKYLSDDINYPVGLHTLWSYQLVYADADDDGQQYNLGAWNPVLSGNWIYPGSSSNRRTDGGWRFNNITIPNGATITDANLRLYVGGVGDGNGDIEFYGDDSDDANAWGTTPDLPSDLTYTTASSNLLASSLTTSAKNDVDLKDVVQEIVDRAGWSSGSSMRFAAISNNCLGYGSPCAGDHRIQVRNCRTAYGAPTEFPELIINYTVGSVTKTVNEIGSGSDSLNLSVNQSITETGSGNDGFPSLDANVLAIENGFGADGLSLAVSVALSDVGLGQDNLTVLTSILKLVTEAATGSDVISQVSAQYSVVDNGSGNDQLILSTLLSLNENASGNDSVSVSSQIIKTILEAATGSDSVSATVSVSISESGTGIDALLLNSLLALAETGSGIEVVNNFDSSSRITTITFSLSRRSMTFDLKKRNIEFILN